MRNEKVVNFYQTKRKQTKIPKNTKQIQTQIDTLREKEGFHGKNSCTRKFKWLFFLQLYYFFWLYEGNEIKFVQYPT